VPTLEYEALDIRRMELPPGWRGYGARDAIEHPETALRLAKIEQIRSELGTADRHTVQQALMPFLHLLPAHLRGANARLEENA
jgi:fumarate reductase flavoprotein subunit